MDSNNSSAQIAQHFHKPINDAAKDLNICATVLKKICRQHGLLRWPSRKVYLILVSENLNSSTDGSFCSQLKSLKKVVQILQAQIETVPQEDKEKRTLIMKKVHQARLEVANTLLVH